MVVSLIIETPPTIAQLKFQLNRASRITDKLIRLENKVADLADTPELLELVSEVKKLRLALNDCIYHLRKPNETETSR